METKQQSYIIVTFRLDGTHRWSDCPHEDVAFLRNYHRHMFHFEVCVKVNHDDRDIEIIRFKRELIDRLTNHYYMNDADCLLFGDMSCEMICDEVRYAADDICGLNEGTMVNYVKILEDGENGALKTY